MTDMRSRGERERDCEMEVRVQLRRAAMRYADHLSRCERVLTDEETALLDGFVAQQTRELTRDLRLHANAWP